MRSPLLHTARLVIRSLTPEDARSLFSYRSNPAVSMFQLWKPADETEALEFIKKYAVPDFGLPNTWNQLGLYLKLSSDLIGDIGLHFLDEQSRGVEIGFTVSHDFQRQGYAFEAVRAVLSFLFETMGKHRVTASVDPRNAASIAFLEKLGLRKEAHFHESLWYRGEWIDDVVYAMLEREWATLNQPKRPGER